LLLKDPRVNPAARNNMAVITASLKNNTGILGLLLADPSVNPSAMNNAALLKAVSHNNHKIVRMLLKYGSFIF
jgi:hypothetical protein